MFELVLENPLRFLLALGIGVATGWWIWARWGAQADAEASVAMPEPAAPPPVVVPAPVAVPEPVAIAEAVGLAAPIPAAEARPAIAAAVGADDDLCKIKGIGPKLDDLCRSLGVRRFDQIAGWSALEVAEVDRHLGNFSGRIARDEWIEQARLLSEGKLAEWEAAYGGGTNT